MIPRSLGALKAHHSTAPTTRIETKVLASNWHTPLQAVNTAPIKCSKPAAHAPPSQRHTALSQYRMPLQASGILRFEPATHARGMCRSKPTSHAAPSRQHTPLQANVTRRSKPAAYTAPSQRHTPLQACGIYAAPSQRHMPLQGGGTRRSKPAANAAPRRRQTPLQGGGTRRSKPAANAAPRRRQTPLQAGGKRRSKPAANAAPSRRHTPLQVLADESRWSCVHTGEASGLESQVHLCWCIRRISKGTSASSSCLSTMHSSQMWTLYRFVD